jgi:hypothetical protein
MRPTLFFVLASFAAAVPRRTHAQQVPTYARALGDTIRYREITNSQSWLRLPQDSILITSLHDATIALTFLARDTASAWYEALVLNVIDPNEQRRPVTTAALYLPFVLAFDARGHVTTVSAPAFPASFEGVSDLTKEFYEFFPELPPRALTIGLTWADTVVRSDSGNGKYFRSTIIGRHTVAGDTVVQGEPATVIRANQSIVYEAGSPVPGKPLRTDTRLAGEANQVVLFAVGSGRMLRKQRSGVLRGTLNYVGGARPIAIPQSYAYDNTVEIVR